MWSLRRASFNPRNRGLSIGTARICCGKSERERCFLENNNAGNIELQGKILDGLLSCARSYNSFSGFSESCYEVRAFSSEASSKNSGKEDGISELEATHDPVQEATSGDESDDELISEPELSEEECVAGADVVEKRSPRTEGISAMTTAILAVPTSLVDKVLNKWVEDGNEVTETEALSTMLYLRKRRMYVKALQMSEWLESMRHFEFGESFYASRVDLIAKVRGVFKAEGYIIKQIPESFRGERVYRNLLANCASIYNVKKTEEVFKKMRSLAFPISCFSFNQLLILYKKTDKTKIADVLLLMEKENVKPSLFTYQILIDVKGQQNDIIGMEQIVETMNEEGVKSTSLIQAILARHYAHAGLKDKAEALLKELEGDDIMKNRWICKSLLPLYASLGREDEVERIWKVCESNPRFDECMAAIESWGKLHRIGNAEAVFEKIMEKMKSPSSKHFIALLSVYANHKMLEKGKNLVKRMEESGVNVGPLTWDALVKLYVGAGEVEKADSILEKAAWQKRGKPMFTSYMSILHHYSNRGDIHNSEKTFLKMRQAGYASGIQQFKALLRAYIIAKTPVYGFIERMKADNMLPGREIANMLAQADAFRKTGISELLD